MTVTTGPVQPQFPGENSTDDSNRNIWCCFSQVRRANMYKSRVLGLESQNGPLW